MRQNWAGNVTFSARQFARPSTLDSLRSLVAGSSKIKIVGTGHSFSDVSDTDGDLISLAAMPSGLDISPSEMTVKVPAGIRYGELASQLHASGFALHNLGSLPHLSVGGAVATGTHGSGTVNLAAAVSSLDVVRADGSVALVSHPGEVVALGALGAVTHVTLRMEPAFEIRQYVYDDIHGGQWDEVFGTAYSVSVFTRWDGRYQAWLKSRDEWSAPDHWLGGSIADDPRHPIAGMPASNCTAQGGVPGPWHERLPHFRLEFTPSSGEELQSEYFVPRSQLGPAIAAIEAIGDLIRPVLQISELRTVNADEMWLSPAYQRDCLAIHFTWISDVDRVTEVIKLVEARLAELDARPHWGKLFALNAASRYPRFSEFAALVRQHDPAGKFRNRYLEALLDETNAVGAG